MKWTPTIFLLCLFFLKVEAQYMTLNVDTADLGVVFENQADSMLVYLKNTHVNPEMIQIKQHAAFPYYGDTVVNIRYANQSIAQGDSLPIWVVAIPEHNVKHKGSILVIDEVSGGHAIIPYKFQGRYSNTYYSATENKAEATLRTQLKSTISSGYTQLSYNNARDEMYSDLDNVNGDVECVYTGRTATFNTRAGANSNSFNCEHTFPQGFFSQNLPMRSDIHHLFPTDVSANSQRGNLPFGTVSNPSWQNGGSKKNSSTFEPRNAQKGATARAMMYFVTRYQDYSNHFNGQETILRQWHDQYPPSQSERTRNNGIYQLQNNRNPFVDYPQFTERITNLVGSTSAPDNPGLFVVDTVELVYVPNGFDANRPQQFYIMNFGNVSQNLNGFQFSGGGASQNIQFTGGAPNGVLSSSYAKEINITYNDSIDLSGVEMSFDATIGSSTMNYTVYFKSVLSPSASIPEFFHDLDIRVGMDLITWQSQDYQGTASLIDMTGKRLTQIDLSKNQLNISEFNGGIYIITFESNRGIFSQKIVIAR